jgi:hypothetical protein
MNAIDIKNYVENRINHDYVGTFYVRFDQESSMFTHKLDPQYVHYDVLLQCDRTFERFGEDGYGFAETDNVDSVEEALNGLLKHLYYFGYSSKRELQSTINRQVKRERTYGIKGEFENYGPTQTARWANRLRYLLMQS